MSQNTDRLVGDLKRVAEDAEHVLKETAADAGEKARQARERLARTIESARACVKDLEEKAIAGAKATDKAIHEHPYSAMGVALGVGILVGWLLTRKN